MELEIKEQQVVAPAINFNFDELKAQAEEIAKQYTSVVITEENYKAAKADAKALGGYVRELETKRKDIKRQMEAPIKEFDSKCKELGGILASAKEEIEKVTDNFDQKRIQEKREKAEKYRLTEIKKAGIEGQAEKVVINESLINLTSTLKSIRADIDDQINTIVRENEIRKNLKEIVTTSLEEGNKELSNKLNPDDFDTFIETALTKDTPSTFIVTTVNAAIEKQKAFEAKVKEDLRKKEEEQKRAEELARATAQAQKEEAVSSPVQEIPSSEPAQTEFETPIQASVKPFKAPTDLFPEETKEPEWSMTIVLTGKTSGLKAIGDILKDECNKRGCGYEVDKRKCYKIS